MKGLETEYANESLKVIWIGFQDRENKIKDFMERHGMSSGVAYDAGDAVSKKYGIKYGAGLVMINRDGIVVKRVPKGFSEDVLKRSLDILLKENQS